MYWHSQNSGHLFFHREKSDAGIRFESGKQIDVATAFGFTSGRGSEGLQA
jgi:hypothetical protein